MKKSTYIFTVSILLISVLGWFFYTNFLKYTIQEVQKMLFKEIDSININTKAPNQVLVQNCMYDLDSQTDDFLKSIPEFSNYTWNNDSKKATISLDNNELLIVERGGCNHFSFYGTLYLENSSLTVKNKLEIFKRAMWIAEKLFEYQEYELFRYALETGNYQIEKYENQFIITFKTDQFCSAELLFIANPKTKKVEIKIGYYLC